MDNFFNEMDFHLPYYTNASDKIFTANLGRF